MVKLTLYVFIALLILCSCVEDILNIFTYAKVMRNLFSRYPDSCPDGFWI